MIGKYRHSLDGKGRLAIPAKFREELGSNFYITIGLDHSLMILSEDGWNAIIEKTGQQPMTEAKQMRFIFANALRCEPDKQGRVLISDELRKYAGLTDKAVIVGFGHKAEIWDEQRYDEMEAAFFEQDNIDAVFAALSI